MEKTFKGKTNCLKEFVTGLAKLSQAWSQDWSQVVASGRTTKIQKKSLNFFEKGFETKYSKLFFFGCAFWSMTTRLEITK